MRVDLQETSPVRVGEVLYAREPHFTNGVATNESRKLPFGLMVTVTRVTGYDTIYIKQKSSNKSYWGEWESTNAVGLSRTRFFRME